MQSTVQLQELGLGLNQVPKSKHCEQGVFSCFDLTLKGAYSPGSNRRGIQ